MVHYGERFFMSLGFRAAAADVLAALDVHASRATAMWSATPAPGTSISWTTCASKCASSRRPRISRPFITSSATISTSALTTQQPPLFRDSANDGFHEAIGDTIALSVTPEYLKQIGLLETVPPTSADIGLLMHKALEKVAFLPFGLLIDKWRWEVFSGKITPADYNKAWWDLRQKYQGIAPPVARSEADFDPGAKYHVPSNTPYARYFLAAILQFQFHRALCQSRRVHRARCIAARFTTTRQRARSLNKMLEMGQSRPWPDALEALTGQRANGRHRDARIFRAAEAVARRAKQE